MNLFMSRDVNYMDFLTIITVLSPCVLESQSVHSDFYLVY